jgi:uncharacterized OB-fold protein
LLPDLEEPTANEFWFGCARGELLVQACGACGKWRMPPRPMCPYCRSTDVKWDRTSGRGRVWSFIVPHPPLLPAYADPSTITIGEPVQVVFHQIDDVTLPRWVRA